MNITALRSRLMSFIGAVATVFSTLVIGFAAASPASADVQADCVGAKDKVVDVTRTLLNGADYAADGHIWALDSYLDHIQIWRVGEHQYCVRIEDSGTFVTFAGVSPNLTGTVSAGVTGTWTGTITAYMTGEFAPVVPVTGYLGEYDMDCHQDGTCAYQAWANRLFFHSGVEHVRYADFAATFDGGAHGTWIQTMNGNTGDIIG